jgi:bifunctional non-homologous end joining protein LigD
LLVGYYDGDRFRYAGKVGTGYTREVLLDLRRRFDGLGRTTNPFDDGESPNGEGVHWVEPKLVAEIAFAEWTQYGLLRQPRYEGLRPDKAARECRRERPMQSAAVRAHAGEATSIHKRETTMPLEEYRAKRDFTKTGEPAGTAAKPHKQPIFVVQEHHASTLHYDFRLEADGVLKSWSVPKGPSLNPGVKRLAVQVEDHPIGYATFAGTIPEGQYGAGTVTIWDNGTYESLMGEKAAPRSAAEAIAAGRLEFVMHGGRLKGKFVLIRMKTRGKGKPQWLLMKSKDEFAETGDGKPAPKPKTARPSTAASVPPVAGSITTSEEVTLTHPDRVLFPDTGLTKKDVFTYYERVADRLLPFLRDRPVTLERLPEGLAEGGPHFWQKNTPATYPAWIPRVELKTERGKAVSYALVNYKSTLLYLVNQGTLTFHPWLSRVESLDRPDFVLFDLDPGQATFRDVVAVARAVKAELDEEGAESVVKTSGKTGLHVLTLWSRAGGYDEARAWALEFAERVAKTLPDRATVDIRKARRGDRVYVDVLQNARGHHAVPPYVMRAAPGATVSTPLDWREVTEKLDPAAFTPKKIVARLARRKADPMAGFMAALGGTRTKAAGRR